VGFMQTPDSDTLFPLYARSSPTHRHRYNYHTVSTNHFKLPVIRDKRDCTENIGCDELFNGDQVYVPGLSTPLTVRLYSRDFNV
jgi:hypothetical protein